jgi:hypothetical protein
MRESEARTIGGEWSQASLAPPDTWDLTVGEWSASFARSQKQQCERSALGPSGCWAPDISARPGLEAARVGPEESASEATQSSPAGESDADANAPRPLERWCQHRRSSPSSARSVYALRRR